MLSGSVIATQSPMSNTDEDFWLMVLEQKCKSIVMLNDPSDVTHHVYYPNSKDSVKRFGAIEVQLVQGPTFKTDPSWNQSPYEEEPHGLKIRILTIKKEDKTHTLTHYQYMNWKDNKLGSEGCVGKLVTAVYEHQGKDPSPIIVHCLSGIGRTGAFATIYDQYCKWKNNEPLNILKCVEQQRSPETGRYCNMIPLTTQYLFCYHTLQFLCKT
jgi:tyrosine-protein phosphatase non-receptor type 23